MKLTRNVIEKRGKLLKVALEKEGDHQRWEFYLKIGNSEHRWTAQGTDEDSIKGVTIDAWHSLALLLVAEEVTYLFADAVRGIRSMVADYEVRQREASIRAGPITGG